MAQVFAVILLKVAQVHFSIHNYNWGFVTIEDGNRKYGIYVSELTEHLRIGGLSPSFRVIQRIYEVLCREWVGNWGDTYWNSFHVW